MTSQNVTKIFDIQKNVGRTPYKTRHSGRFGIEIETETDNKYKYPVLKFWEPKEDRSLRGFGVEYVLKAPLDSVDLTEPLKEFKYVDEQYKFKRGSVSTSVHVHMNMQNETYKTVANIMTVWALIEPILVRYSGPDRMSNLFCFGLMDVEGLLDKWIGVLNMINRNTFGKVAVSQDQVKYSALNIATLSSLGTLEARTFRGELDTNVIQKWVDILGKIVSFSSDPDMDPSLIMKMYDEQGINILDIIFGELAEELKIKDYKKLISFDEIFHASKIACVSKDWSRFGILKVKPIYKEMIRPQLEELAQVLFKSPYDQLKYEERNIVIERYHQINVNMKVVDATGDI
jgi:hypothetical protein